MMIANSKKIGVLGLGAIGQPIASRLLQAGHTVIVFDVREDVIAPLRGMAEVASSPKDLGGRAEIIFGCLASAAAHRDALLGAAGVMHGTIVRTYVNLSTIGSRLIQEISQAMDEKGIATIDAPVTGGVERAREGNLTTMTAGDRHRVEEVEPLIRSYSNHVVWMGSSLSSAQVMKAVNNAVSYANLAAACEAMVVGAKAGLDASAMLEVLNRGSGQNSATLTKIPSDILTGRFAFGGKLGIVAKDLRVFLEEAEMQGVDPVIGQIVFDAYMAAIDLESDAGDVTHVVRPMEIEAGIVVRTASDRRPRERK